MEISFTPNDRGQVGIGTLIVFIAMVLVAAIAAGVLINTAGFLQTQAEDTGTESTEQVANNLNVITETGIVNDTGSGVGTVSDIEVGVQPAAGSDDLNLEELSLQYVADESFSNLVHVKSVSAGDDNQIVGEDTVFNTVPVTAEDGEDNVMTDNADRYDIVVPLDDERPFVETAEFENVESEETETFKIDIAFQDGEEGTNGLQDLSAVAGAVDGVDEDDFIEVNATQDNFDEAVLFEIDDNDAAFTTDPDESVPDGAENDEDIVRVVAYVDEVDALQLNGFDEDLGELEDGDGELVGDGALDPEFFDELSNDNLEELVEGEEVELTYTTETGAQTTSILQVPDSLAGQDDDDAVDL